MSCSALLGSGWAFVKTSKIRLRHHCSHGVTTIAKFWPHSQMQQFSQQNNHVTEINWTHYIMQVICKLTRTLERGWVRLGQGEFCHAGCGGGGGGGGEGIVKGVNCALASGCWGPRGLARGLFICLWTRDRIRWSNLLRKSLANIVVTLRLK